MTLLTPALQAPSPLHEVAQSKVETATAKEEELRRASREFEAAFIAEMLSYAGFDKALSSRGGFGAEAFSKMLVEAYATSISKQGGFGIAEKIYSQLKD